MQHDDAQEVDAQFAPTRPEWLPVNSVSAQVPPPKRERKSKPLALLKELVIVLVLAFTLSGLVKFFLVQNFEIPSGSMLETLQVNDRIAVSKLSPSLRELHRGDIVVFTDSQHWLPANLAEENNPNPAQSFLILIGVLPESRNNHLVKRIIGMEGDRVTCCTAKGNVSVNGVEINETYLRPGVAPSEQPFDVTVPKGHLWVMGDNRSNSSDSRAHMNQVGGGFVPLSDVTGRAFLRWWPLDRWSTLNSGNVFDTVPEPK